MKVAASLQYLVKKYFNSTFRLEDNLFQGKDRYTEYWNKFLCDSYMYLA